MLFTIRDCFVFVNKNDDFCGKCKFERLCFADIQGLMIGAYKACYMVKISKIEVTDDICSLTTCPKRHHLYLATEQ